MYGYDRAYRCDNTECNRLSVVWWSSSNNRDIEPTDRAHSVEWSPPPIERSQFPDVPPRIAAAAKEAWLCHGHGANIAACAVARSVIEASAKDFNIAVNGIYPKIEALSDALLIWGNLVDSAHLVRQFGNDAAHGDITQPVTVEEARDVLDIMNELLHQLFTSPARAERLKASRVDRK